MYSDQEHFQTVLESRIYDDLSHINQVSADDIEYMKHSGYRGFHIKIVDNKLHIITEKPAYELRNYRLLDCLNYLVNNFTIKDTEFVIHTDDYPPDINLPMFVQSKKKDQNCGILYPDFSFYTWDWPVFPEASVEKWDDFRTNIKNHYIPISQKRPVCFFRGNQTNPIRQIFYESTKNNKTFDIDISVSHNSKTQYIPLKNHTHYKYLLNLPGRSSSGRLKYLFMMRSIVFNIKGEYIEFWYHVLKNNYHYFEFDNCETSIDLIYNKIFELENNFDAYLEIIYNMQEIEKYFSMHSVMLYWLRLLSIYTNKLNYKVVL